MWIRPAVGRAAGSALGYPSLGDLDVFALVADDDAAWCSFVRIVRGTVTGSLTVQIAPGAEQDPRAILTAAIQQIGEGQIGEGIEGNSPPVEGGVADSRAASGELKAPSTARRQEWQAKGGVVSPKTQEIIVPFLPEEALFPNKKFTIPKRGEKLALLEFAEKNARLARAEHLKNLEIKDPEKATDRIMAAMQRELHLPREPRHIECFDNSNLQGTHPVASCVVFRDGRPSRREYRHFNVKTVIGPDDFASMREIVSRRYTRLLAENTPLPDLVVVDGGKGQLSAAYGVFTELGIADRVPLVGLAKRIEEVFFPSDPEPYYLSRNGQPLKVMMHIRDEAHRFGITFHRNKRSASFIRSELENIPGIGPKTIATLLKQLKTISAIRTATPEALADAIGQTRATALRNYFDDSRAPNN